MKDFWATCLGVLLCGLPAAWAENLMPTDAELEAAGARIGSIRIVPRDIFDLNDPRENTAFYRLANRLHLETRESTLRAQLLFQTGDLYSRRLLDETARNMRRLRFLREPVVRAVAYHDGLVDIEVHSHDVWTLNPGVSFGRSGGENRNGFEIDEYNLLGYGKRLSLGYTQDVDRSTKFLRWADPNVLGSRWTDAIELTDTDDGKTLYLSAERPFFALYSRWSAGFTLSSEDSQHDRYSLGTAIDTYDVQRRYADVFGGWSKGLRNSWVRRTIAGVRYDDNQFAGIPGMSTLPVPQNRRLAYPYVRAEWLEDDFSVAANLDQIQRSEDQQFGRLFSAQLGFATNALGSDRDVALLALRAYRGWRLSEKSQLFVDSSLSGRFGSGQAENVLLSFDSRLYRRNGRRMTFYASLSGNWTNRLDADRDLILGGEDGLRGYPLRYQSGKSRVLLTVEQRLYTSWYLFRLAHIGAAAFIDVGRIYGQDATNTPNKGWLADAGLGLRLGNARSALGNMLHIDLAFPLNADPSIDNLQILVQTKRSF
jgi:outer membrane protein assembly factor BamA